MTTKMVVNGTTGEVVEVPLSAEEEAALAAETIVVEEEQRREVLREDRRGLEHEDRETAIEAIIAYIAALGDAPSEVVDFVRWWR